MRIAYNLFTQKPKGEKEDFARWMKMTRPGRRRRFLSVNGAGEMLVFSAADFEDFLEPRPDLPPSLEGELKEVVIDARGQQLAVPPARHLQRKHRRVS